MVFSPHDMNVADKPMMLNAPIRSMKSVAQLIVSGSGAHGALASLL
jgi:hypothetical protein